MSAQPARAPEILAQFFSLSPNSSLKHNPVPIIRRLPRPIIPIAGCLPRAPSPLALRPLLRRGGQRRDGRGAAPLPAAAGAHATLLPALLRRQVLLLLHPAAPRPLLPPHLLRLRLQVPLPVLRRLRRRHARSLLPLLPGPRPPRATAPTPTSSSPPAISQPPPPPPPQRRPPTPRGRLGGAPGPCLGRGPVPLVLPLTPVTHHGHSVQRRQGYGQWEKGPAEGHGG